jgi:exopolysaccharide production protein ExoZ
MGRIGSVQALRFFAALGVTYCHVTLNFGGPTGWLGAMGVDVFFVISGFIITRAAMKSPEGFLRHRIARVLPPYYLVVIPWFIMSIGEGIDWRRTLATFALWPVTDQFAMPYLFVAWSLCFEALFYACIWLVLRGVPARWLIVAYATAMALGALTLWPPLVYLGSPLILEFLMGVAIALMPNCRPKLGAMALALGAAVIVAYAIAGGPKVGNCILLGQGWPIRPLVWGVPAALLVFGAAQFPRQKLGPLEFLGDTSYSLYLVHLPVILALGYLSTNLAGAVLACVLAGGVFHIMAERPGIKIARALLFSRRGAPTSSGPARPTLANQAGGAGRSTTSLDPETDRA